MRRKDKEITDNKIIEEILSGSEICRIAIADVDTPYIVPLNYGYRNGYLYFHTASQGRKIDLLKRNNRVAFEIEFSSEITRDDLPCKWTTRYRSLIGAGTVEIIEEINLIKEGLDIIMTHYGHQQKNYEEAYLKRIVILRLSIDRISGKQSGDWN